MPYKITKRGGKYCVVSDSGRTAGCHDSREKAIKQQRALYANEPGLSASAHQGNTVNSMEAFTAAAAPIYPSKMMFEIPETDGPFPMTYEDNGQVFGHLALWETCHTGLSAGAFSECVRPPRSESDYSHFHLGQMKTAEGEMIAVGKITLATGHAPMTADSGSASQHYDNTGSVGAFVRATNGQHGIWASGVVRSDITEEQLRDLRANPVSGDWRAINHRLELVAALAVPVPGFPIPMALAASGEVTALILTGPSEDDFVENDRNRAYFRRKALISRKRQ